MSEEQNFYSKAVWAGPKPETWTHWDVMPPISLSSIFKQESPGSCKLQDYSRHGNPTRWALERTLAELEEANYSLVFSSGMAAIVAVTNLLNSGDHIICVDDLYPGTSCYFNEVASRMNITTTYVNASNENNFRSAIKKNTKLVWLESPSNPQLRIANIREIVSIVKNHNPDILVALDNTFLSPALQKPLKLGVDISVMSLTKYMGGHHDAIMGSVTFNDPQLHKRLYFLQKATGAIPSGFDCYQMYRSTKTLAVRMEKHQKSGLIVAKWLENHPKVEKVNHPMLESNPQRDLFMSQAKGHSGMISFIPKGTVESAKQFVMSLKKILLVASLGGTATTVFLPLAMFPKGTNEKSEKSNSFPPSLIRLSVGLEDPQDIIDDLEQAFSKI